MLTNSHGSTSGWKEDNGSWRLIDQKVRPAVLILQWLQRIGIIHSNIELTLKYEQKISIAFNLMAIDTFLVLHIGEDNSFMSAKCLRSGNI